MLEVQRLMRNSASPEKARNLQRFFQTGPGQYAEGDQFLGLTVPQTRGFLPHCRTLTLEQLEELLHSAWHEERLLAVLALAKRARREPDAVYDLYLRNVARFVNNWDLVDSSAPAIVGEFLLMHPDPETLQRLARSENLWERRVAVLATQAFIRRGQFDEILQLCRMLLADKHPLIHKACGWMLREVGKREESVLRTFLDENARGMPRTMLRYALEKLAPEERAHYMRRG